MLTEYDLMMKCDMCYDRTSVGKKPMCATVCPSGALFYLYTEDLAGAKEVYDEMSHHPEKYPAVSQVVSIYTFVPPPETAAANARVLEEWRGELKDIDVKSLPLFRMSAAQAAARPAGGK